MPPRNLDQMETAELQQSFPNINIEHVRVTLEVGEDHNCVAYAVDETEHYEPGSVAEMRRFMTLRGYYEVPAGDYGADIDFLGVDPSYVRHVTRRYRGPWPLGVPPVVDLWESKLGPGDMAITHCRRDLCESGANMTQLGGIIASFKKR